MRKILVSASNSLFPGLVLAVITISPALAGSTGIPGGWSHYFPVNKAELKTTGRNPYFILEPGYRLVLKDGPRTLTITVTEQTENVDGIETRLVKEDEERNGRPVEISKNYYAISGISNSVYYFGEDSGGSWHSGQKGARFGMAMPGTPLPGAKYYEEIAPGVDMDRAEIISTWATVRTPSGVFRHCLKIRETNPLEKGETEYKYYAPGIGLVQDESYKLVKYGMRVTRP